ncbi:S-adenosylmethionine-6-N',N'-adenosyl (rRNA) dimethyltransferase, kasugamycin resistance [Candidatus Competibacter denitrificans Run_A_D11]|uniref:Ribosomal RNA small subunit methyltransferase A n=1 Tax=Candidatus Competibacter denitrificans Run_A_D11 TaxID=1400863 RepID=W6M9K3_9GAMM|nr:16S rRNA (adenine(1518)-N(6)/adenine(1519)-N(6))-dimethyltransferase RsmA [Candidatus Competibacter denitrificans]CDI04282.1 S-adenosylmethionine-6-N',N'-adenosyl (rRNA) dimethyltransferase, kasugamycin resistance [Candidatus Competibacter denitrificans Run_A_D11]HRC69129.1 16S rRNA (adenine(1518)-N(6)/adenine(1519)-N(6))-dimethyltransferase RsmA [Candidatus Competibacter denitrificans]
MGVTGERLTHRARKRFGQHFLRDPYAIERLLAAIRPLPEDRLVEIGPGLGALTRPLLVAAGALDAVELDRDVLEPLRVRCAGLGTLRLHQADALTFDFAALRGTGPLLRIVGNLPYNISTPLLFHLLGQAEHLRDLHLMLQQEVVARMAAGPGEDAYGRLSVMLQYRCQVMALFTVGPEAFQPPPKVWSAVVRLIPHATLPVKVQDEQQFAEVVRRAFAQRRKTLRNALRGLLDVADIEAAGVDPGARPETLDLAAFAALSHSRCKNPLESEP